ncbi:MAG TPA: methyl-accepting chemotaxis protein [Myxococcota bacterium]|nr:methyl-accepting chemotaxis protein [Myxococcota bacterium]
MNRSQNGALLRSAQRRALVLMACALGLVSAVVGGVLVARTGSEAREFSRGWLRSAAAELARLGAQPMTSPSAASLGPILSAAKGLPGVVDAAFVDSSGHIVISTRASEIGRLAPAAWRETGETPVFRRGGEDASDSTSLVVAPVALGKASLGGLVLRITEPNVATTGRRAFGVAAAVAGLAIAALLVVFWHLFGSLLAPVAESERVLSALASGDVSARLDGRRLGSFASLGRGLNTLAEALGGVLSRVQHLTQRMQSAPERVSQAMDEIATGVEAQTEAVEETASLLANINTSIKGINAEVDSLSRSAEEASSSVLQMGSAIDEVARSAASLHESVDSSTSSIHEMGASIRQVAESADAVQRMAEETASSMTQMDRTIQEVGEHVREASVLTQQVSQGAEVGSSAVSDTIEGIEEIRNLTRGAKDVLERLAARINEIGEIVNVIGGINDETNLLSLNAAIIAAQAGEQGKAFAVVANHVKTLAQRTAGSTQEIDRLIRAVQAESENAMRAMGAGIDSVEAGVARSSRAGEALQAIRTSARDASARVAEIARAAHEQAQSSRHVAEAAQRTSQMVQQISGAIGEQSRASEAMLKNSEGALEVCRQVHRSTSEQRETAKFITASIASVAEMIRSIQENTASHARASESVSHAVSRILETARKSSERIPEVLSTVEELRGDADALAQEVGRFRS